MTTDAATISQPDATTFRAAMASFPTGVALLTQGTGAETNVMTLNCFVSVSLQPLLIMVGVGGSGRMTDEGMKEKPRPVKCGAEALDERSAIPV